VRFFLLTAAASMSVALGAQAPAGAGVSSLLDSFLNAGSAAKAARLAPPIVESGAGFDAVLARLKEGRRYTSEAPGIRKFDTVVNSTFLDNTLDVPDGYDPAKRWPLRVQLHGGVGRMPPQRGETAARPLNTNRIPGEPQLVLQPRAWATTEWWERNQAKNVLDLVDQIKRAYNVDESRIYITGISDGGTGVYFFAMRDATRWSACLPLNGHPSVLANPDTGADGSLFVGNLVNCPMYLVNGGRDPLYPAASVAPLVEMMKQAGVPVTFTVYAEAGHDTSWWPTERPMYEAFLAAHARTAHPAHISWETERTDRYNRFRWLVIDRLGARPSDVELEDVNSFALPSGRKVTLYTHPAASGRVDVTRTGNAFEARTRGVQQFTLLLSPDVIDFSRPVTVTVNGRRAFEGTVTRDVSTLLAWAAKDDDRTMLYGAELKMNVP
jgi:poly(3-hydroxybutyrate) depolymerase